MAKRKLWQLGAALIGNGYFKGFITGDIFKGSTKFICFPGLNCYSCPGALGSCPIGALQAVIIDLRYRFSFYLLGFFVLLGTASGRLVCGWLCPFGLVQELFYKNTPSEKRLKLNFITRYLKYAVLLVFVVALPLFWLDDFGFGQPTFCKFICPAGTLQAGVPLLIVNESLRSAAGFLSSVEIVNPDRHHHFCYHSLSAFLQAALSFRGYFEHLQSSKSLPLSDHSCLQQLYCLQA